jgi:Protein of unknown function (DUF4242)
MGRQVGRLHRKRQALASLICLQLTKEKARINMPKYVVEREVPGIGNATEDQVRAISQKSCNVLNKLGPAIQWQHSYVTANKIYCIYIAPDENTIRKHAEQGGFPANSVSEVKSMIDPTTAE